MGQYQSKLKTGINRTDDHSDSDKFKSSQHDNLCV